MVHRRSNCWIRSIITVAGAALIASTAGIATAEQPPAPLIDRTLAPLPPVPRQVALDLPSEPPKAPSPSPFKTMALVIERQPGSVKKPLRGTPVGTVRTALRKPDSLRWNAVKSAPLAPAPKPLPQLAKDPAKPSAKETPFTPVRPLPVAPPTVAPAKQTAAKPVAPRRFDVATLQPTPATNAAPATSGNAARQVEDLPKENSKATVEIRPQPVVEAKPPTPVTPEELRTAPIVGSGIVTPETINPLEQQEYGVPGLSNLPPSTGVAIFGDDFKPIGQVSAVIKPAAGDLPTDFAGPKFAQAGEMVHLPGEMRPWAMQSFHWTAPNSHHKPLYFEEVNLERHGYTYGRIFQPYLSGANFFGSIAILPYKMALDGPCQNIYTLGHYRPGSYAPYERYTVPFELYPTLVEAGAITALFVIFP